MFSASDLGKLLQQSQKMQQMMGEVQQRLAEQTVSASSGGGMVTALVNGNQQLVELKIDAELIKQGDTTFIADLVRAAVNSALVRSKEMMGEELKQIGAGMGLPLGNLF